MINKEDLHYAPCGCYFVKWVDECPEHGVFPERRAEWHSRNVARWLAVAIIMVCTITFMLAL